MTIKITNATTDVAVLNRWADGIERQLRTHNTQLIKVSSTIGPPGVGGSASTSFDKIKSGTNINQDLVVGGGSKLEPSGSGIINANEIGAIEVDGNKPTREGQLLISQPGNKAALWADPLVQGLATEGSDASSTNPVLIGGKDVGRVRSAAVDSDGAIHTSSEKVLQEILIEVKAIRAMFVELFEEAGSKVSNV